jgi:hypothetical protein
MKGHPRQRVVQSVARRALQRQLPDLGDSPGPVSGHLHRERHIHRPTGPRTSFASASAFESTFRIESGSTIVTGTKTFVSGNGRGEDDFGGGRDGVELFAIVEYEARKCDHDGNDGFTDDDCEDDDDGGGDD